MTKNEFISQVAERAGMTKKDAERATDMVFETMADAMAHGDKVCFPGFGTFKTRQRAAFTARHPRTGEPLAVSDTVIPVFEASKGLKEKVNQ